MDSEETPQIARHHCNSCRQVTKHDCIFKTERQYADDDLRDYWIAIWTLWECRGCESILAIRESFLDSDRELLGEQGTTYFPDRRTGQYATRKTFRKVTAAQQRLYREVIDAFNSKAFILCSVGLRSLLESICRDKVPEATGNLASRIEALSPIVPSGIMQNLHGFRFLGNEAIHELQTPRAEHLVVAIEVIEDLLSYLYDLDYKTARLYRLVTEKKSPK